MELRARVLSAVARTLLASALLAVGIIGACQVYNGATQQLFWVVAGGMAFPLLPLALVEEKARGGAWRAAVVLIVALPVGSVVALASLAQAFYVDGVIRAGLDGGLSRLGDALGLFLDKAPAWCAYSLECSAPPAVVTAARARGVSVPKQTVAGVLTAAAAIAGGTLVGVVRGSESPLHVVPAILGLALPLLARASDALAWRSTQSVELLREVPDRDGR